jgi:hypothetical protein
MLSHILGIIQEFERSHGRRPQLVYLNHRHLQELMQECPALFDSETAAPLGFRIVVLSEAELPHPKAVWIAPRVPALRRSPRISSGVLSLKRRSPSAKNRGP